MYSILNRFIYVLCLCFREDSLGLNLYFEDLILREQLHEPIYNSMSLMGMLINVNNYLPAKYTVTLEQSVGVTCNIVHMWVFFFIT